MNTTSLFGNLPQEQFEENDGVRHPDFDDSIVTSVYDFLDMFANGRDIPTMKRTPIFDDNADEMLDRGITPATYDYDMLDALDDSEKLNATRIKRDANNVSQSQGINDNSESSNLFDV